MSGIGVEKFREIGNTLLGGDRTVTLTPDGGGVEAPYKFAGRFVIFNPMRTIEPGETQANVAVRQAFCDALVKAYGADTARSAINALHEQGFDDFRASPRDLTASRVAKFIDAADTLQLKKNAVAAQAAKEFLAKDGVLTAAYDVARQAHLPDPTERDRAGLLIRFGSLANGHPEFGRTTNFAPRLEGIAKQAARDHFAAKAAAFDEAHPDFARLNNVAHHEQGFFSQLRSDLNNDKYPGASSKFVEHAHDALWEIEASSAMLARTQFDVSKIDAFRIDVLTLKVQIEEIRAKLGELPQQPGAAAALHSALIRELEREADKLQAKADFLTGYQNRDPLSEKSVAYDKLVWAQAGAVVLDEAIAEFDKKLVTASEQDAPALQGRHDELQVARDQMVKTAKDDFDAAATTRAKDGLPADFAKTNTKQAREAVAGLLVKAGVPVDKLEDQMKQARLQALNNAQNWETITREMFISRDGLTRKYVSEITPAQNLGGAVGASYQNGQHGVSAATKDDPKHPRNLQVSRLYQVTPNGGRVEKHASIRHGVLDMWRISNETARKAANKSAALEVLTVAANLNPAFKQRLLDKAALGGIQPPSKLVHVNFNLTTADRVRSLTPTDGDFSERSFTAHQFEAFEAHHGQQSLSIDDANAVQGSRALPVDVDTITFSFGVNALATNPVANRALGAWAEEEHDRTNLIKLIGDLATTTTPGGYIGGVLRRLEQHQAQDQATTARVAQLSAQIRMQTDTVRNMFSSETFKGGGDDAYKMTRHIMRLVDLAGDALRVLGDNNMALTQSQGCKSGKDRGGMADVEIKAMTIINDMGGSVKPDTPLDEKDRAIYNTVLTSSGQDRVQQLNTGLPGSKNAEDLHVRIGDPHATEYAQGLGSQAKA
jgi:phosphatidylinositol-4,5-bisphosphate 4-phosphatase